MTMSDDHQVVFVSVGIVMAEEKGDGPPNKRQKLGAPDTPPDNAGKYNLCIIKIKA